MKEELMKRMLITEEQIKSFFKQSEETMVRKNRERGDCWRQSGLLAEFIEIHSMYFRLRNLIWESKIPDVGSNEWKIWYNQVKNALEDLRNFTVLGELCLMEKNIKGDEYIADSAKLGDRKI